MKCTSIIRVDQGTKFMAWCIQYSSLSELVKEEPATQVKVFMLHLSRETLSIAQNLGLIENWLKESQNIISAMRACVDGHVNNTVQQRNFRRCKQKDR